MSNAVVLVATLLAASLGATAHNAFASAAQENAAQQDRTVTITGCLAVPETGESYILTDASGVAYQIHGDTSSLQDHAQQEVQISGSLYNGPVTSSNAAVQSPASTATDSELGTSASGGQLEISNVKVIATQCRAGVTGLGSQDSSMRRAGGHLRSVNDSVAKNRAATPPENAKAAGQLPQTSTILPLLGLIGLGSLVAGFFARK